MKLTQFRPAGQRTPRVQGSAALNDAEALDAFDSESEPPRAPESEPARAARGLTLRIAPAAILPLVLAATVGVLLGALGFWGFQRTLAARRAGSLRIETSVPGAEVSLGGKVVGRTPVTLSLAGGSYPVQLASAGTRRDFTVDLAAGAAVTRHVELPAAAPVSAVGSLHVQTEPARLVVLVDGVERGPSPLTVEGLKPGEHQVAVRGDAGLVRRTVSIQANENTVLVLSPVERAAPAPAATAASGGWLAIASPFELRIRENGKSLGSTDVERLMLPAGDHTLELVNDALGYTGKRTVKVEAGKTVSLKIDPPNGALSINAQPWAEVWVDGQRIGETPIGNLARPIGSHEVVLRHPEFGERRENVTITLRQPARLGVDMRKK
jgi:hypothetical protein